VLLFSYFVMLFSVLLVPMCANYCVVLVNYYVTCAACDPCSINVPCLYSRSVWYRLLICSWVGLVKP
jgi:hypothetical protein